MSSEKLDSIVNEKKRALQGSDLVTTHPAGTMAPLEASKELLPIVDTETDLKDPVKPSSEDALNVEDNSATSTDLQTVIEQREAQLMKMMHQNAELNESLSKMTKEKVDMQQRMDSLEAYVRNTVRTLIDLLSATRSHTKPD